MDQFSRTLAALHSPDDFRPALPGPGSRPGGAGRDGGPGRAADQPLHDMDSLEFLLWVEQEAEREMARRKGQAAEPAPEQSPEKPARSKQAVPVSLSSS